MSLKSFNKSSGIAALAIGLAALAVPSVASAQDAAPQHGGWHRGNGEQGGGFRGGWRGREQRAPQAQVPQPQVRPTQMPQREMPRAENRERRGPLGLDWSQAQGTRTPDARREQPREIRQAPRGDWQANRTYSAPERNRTYDGRTRQGWDGQQWQGQNWNRDGRTWDRDGDRYRGDTRRWQGDRRDTWSRDWRRDRRYDWRSYRSSNRHVYHLGRYYSPYRSWSYRRLSIGFFLQPLFFSQNYWIMDPWMYRLPEPYGPYRWVRYYDDALLVNVYNGEVVDVLYDVFW